MTIIIFDTSVTGHHLEYIHHLYLMAINDVPNKYVFVIPESFCVVKNSFEWPWASNVSFDLFLDSKIIKYNHSVSGLIKQSRNICQIASFYVDKYCADSLFSIELISFVPVAHFILPKRLKLSGIIYKIYLWNDKTDSLLTRIQNRLKYLLMSKSKVFHKVFILNDSDSANRLNDIYKTDKFKYLPDPFVAMPVKYGFDFRKECGISPEKKMLLHFGAMSVRKGTMEIVKSLDLLSDEQCQNLVFVFLGKIGEEIKHEFYSRCESNKQRLQIVIKDEFCEYEYIASACSACDAILAPYLLTDLSSGIIGYASQFGKPVVAPGTGLLGNIVRKYQLGYLMEKTSADNLLKAYSRIVSNNNIVPSKLYCENNTIVAFIECIRKSFF